MTRKEKVLAFFKDKSYTPMLFSELMSVLCVPAEDTDEFLSILKILMNEGYIIKTKRKRYALSDAPNLIVGKFKGSPRGYGFVTYDDGDVFIGPSFVNGALDGDEVSVKIFKKATDTKRSEGRIEKIILRSKSTFVGRFEKSRNFGFVVADEKRISNDVFISKNHFNKAKTGDKVIVEITRWGDKNKNPEGKIIEVLGNEKDSGIDVLSVMKQYNLEEDFGDNVLEFADIVAKDVTKKDIEGRLDLRKETIITIDGADAKDLDDAINVKKTDFGFTLGVHIADVSHYVTEHSPLDKEAFKRGTSVYLADRVIPMLPKKLSNGICSLNPKVDRLTLSVIMDIDNDGNVVNHKITPSVINSTERMTYDDVYSILEGDKALIKKYKHIHKMLEDMKTLAFILRSNRESKGSIDFDMPEAKVKFDESGRVCDIVKYKITYANHIIEEFMLLANKTVAEEMFWQDIPFIYRVHEVPSLEKITAFNEFLKGIGLFIKGSSKPHPTQYSALLDKVKNTYLERPVSHIMLRSLMKAEYLSENKGHFGLAFKYYCHFTSPIRRYPDLAIHRIIKEYLAFKISDDRKKQLEYFVKKASKASSETEINAQDAERDVLDIKKCEYMEGKIGETFKAHISSVTSFGIYAELDNTVEGLIRLADMKDDYYIYDEKNFTLVGEHTKKLYKIGDEITVKVVSVNKNLREIDFEMEDL